MTVSRAISYCREAFSDFSAREGQVATEWLLTELLNCNRAHLYARRKRELSESEWATLVRMIERHKEGEPLQYITGKAYFYGLPFEVNPSVLIPRPETELLVEAVLNYLPDYVSPQVLDVGTGSGCIAIAIARERRGVVVDATDISLEALEIALHNAKNLGVDVNFVQHDMMTDIATELLRSGYDFIVSNPPYIPLQERDTVPKRVCGYEPGIALFAEDDALKYYRHLNRMARRLLNNAGRLILEVHALLADEVVGLFKKQGWGTVELRKDLSDRPRFVIVQREEG